MNLILLHHGKAQDANPGGDSMRELVQEGFKQARSQAQFLIHAGLLPDIVLTSPLVRARQTAHEFCKAANLPGEIIQGWLACGMSPETAMKELAGLMTFKCVAIVGHEPDLPSLIAHLIGCNPASIQMENGGMACLDIQAPLQQATLKFLIQPASDHAAEAVDLERLKEVTANNEELLRDITREYFVQAEEILADMKHSIEADDHEQICKLAHKLIGSSVTCGMSAIVPSLRTIENLKADQLAEAIVLHEEASRQLLRIRQVLANLRL